MGKFHIKKVPTGLTFHLAATNGETIGTSQVYSSKNACLTGIASVRTNAPVASVEDQTVDGYKKETCPKFEVYAEHGDDKPRFRLLAKNGEKILASQAYTTKASCLAGIDSVVRNAPEAEIIEDEAE